MIAALAEIFAPLIPAIITGGLILGFRNCIDSLYLFENGTKTLCDISQFWSGIVLYYEGYRILKEKRPTYSIIENVKNLTSKRFKSQFDSILKDLSDLGYTNYWKVLNSKDYRYSTESRTCFYYLCTWRYSTK